MLGGLIWFGMSGSIPNSGCYLGDNYLRLVGEGRQDIYEAGNPGSEGGGPEWQNVKPKLSNQISPLDQSEGGGGQSGKMSSLHTDQGFSN